MTPPNVIVLSMDSLRYDRALDSSLMPAIAREAEGGTNFTSFVSNGGNTPGSFPTFMASRYPSSVDGFGIPNDAGTTLAEGLAENGYTCGLFSDNQFLSSDYNYDRGYEYAQGYEKNLKDRISARLDRNGTAYRVLENLHRLVQTLGGDTVSDKVRSGEKTAEEINEEVMAWLGSRNPSDSPIHLWIHYMDSHRYEPPAKYIPDELTLDPAELEPSKNYDKLTSLEVENLNLLYDASCRYLNDELERLISYLREEEWLNCNDILVLTADHGEILNEWEVWREHGHGNFFCEECTHIPFIVNSDGLESCTVDKQASLVDMVPTIFDLVNVTGYDDELMGESLIGLVEGGDEREIIYYDGTGDCDGARRQSTGTKRFNTEFVGCHTYLDVTFEPVMSPTQGYDETIVDAIDSELVEFLDEMDRHFSSREASPGVPAQSEKVRQHMKDLGYL